MQGYSACLSVAHPNLYIIVLNQKSAPGFRLETPVKIAAEKT